MPYPHNFLIFNRTLTGKITNPRLDTMVHLDAASTLVPLIVWAEVCTDVSTARHLCSEGIPHPPRVPLQINRVAVLFMSRKGFRIPSGSLFRSKESLSSTAIDVWPCTRRGAQAWREWYIRVTTGHPSDGQEECRTGIYFQGRSGRRGSRSGPADVVCFSTLTRSSSTFLR